MKVGWVDKRRAFAVSTQTKALLADGVHERKIYDGTQKAPRSAAIRDAGAGGVLTVYRLSCLARNRIDFGDMMGELAAAGIEDITIREVGAEGGPREARLPHATGVMLEGCFADWAQHKVSKADARRHGRKGAAKRWADPDKMPRAEARVIWFDDVNYPRASDALVLMVGWSRSSAFRLGKRGTGVQATVRKPKPKK